MNNEEIVEAQAGPFRLVASGQDIRGFWHREDAELAADDLARKRMPASVQYVGRKGWPDRESFGIWPYRL